MQEINFYHMMKYYAKHWLFIVILSLVGFVGGLVYNVFIQVPQYKSNATLIIIKNDDTTKNTTLINNYIELFKSRKVLEPTINNLKLDEKYETLAKSIEATNDSATEIIKLSITSDSASDSKKILDYAINQFKSEAKKLYKKDNLQIVDSASQEDKPYNVNSLLQLAIATAIGFVSSIVIIFFIYDYKISKVIKNEQQESSAATDSPTPNPIDRPQTQPQPTTNQTLRPKLIIDPPQRSINIPNRRQ